MRLADRRRRARRARGRGGRGAGRRAPAGARERRGRPGGRPPGRYRLGRRAIVSDGRRVEWRGRLAGSALGLDEGARTLSGAGVGVAAALAAAAWAPRRLLGLPGLGLGAPADLVVLDPSLVPRLTLVGGVVAHADAALPFDVPEVGSPV